MEGPRLLKVIDVRIGLTHISSLLGGKIILNERINFEFLFRAHFIRVLIIVEWEGMFLALRQFFFNINRAHWCAAVVCLSKSIRKSSGSHSVTNSKHFDKLASIEAENPAEIESVYVESGLSFTNGNFSQF